MRTVAGFFAGGEREDILVGTQCDGEFVAVDAAHLSAARSRLSSRLPLADGAHC